jgi:hypothetical protein
MTVVIACNTQQEQGLNEKNEGTTVPSEDELIVEASVTRLYGGDKYWYYDIEIIKFIKNTKNVKLESPLKVARLNILSQPEGGIVYHFTLELYNESHPEAGYKFTDFKKK